MARLDEIRAEETLDSRGMPTLEVTVRAGDVSASAKVPSGKSAGSKEAYELRDDDGRGVKSALRNVNEVISPILSGHELDLRSLDESLIELDGTDDKSKLGANAMLGVSIAALRLEAALSGVAPWKAISERGGHEPGFPRLYMNMLNGGAHASWRLPFQEYIVVVGGRGASGNYAKATEIFEVIGTLIERAYGSVPLGDEGGYSPEMREIMRPFEFLSAASSGESGVSLAIDAAASEFFHDGKYVLGGAPFSREDLLDIYRTLVRDHGLSSIEDPFDEDDGEGFESIVSELGERTIIVGDDLTVTNPKLIASAVEKKRANALIIKPNQIGTMTETLEAIAVAKRAGWKVIVSHRSGETDDPFVADLAYGVGAFGLKAGAPTQRERRAKYERLIAIERDLMR